MKAPLLRITLLCLMSVPLIQAQEWTRFRGPNGTGISEAKTIPTKWTEQDLNWRIELAGAGHSSPVVWGEKVFVTSCDEKSGKFFVHCLSTKDGATLWQQEYPVTPYKKHNYNTLASSTPTVDAERVYIYRVDTDQLTILALDHAGKKVWERELGTFKAQHGSGTSPMIYEGKVILANEQDGASSLVALDAKTGEVKWQTPRKTVNASYSTPCVYQPKGGKPELIFNSEANGISGVAPDTGKVVWEFEKAFDKRSVSSPVIAGDLVLGSCGSGGGGNFVVAVKPGDANGAKASRAWEIRRSAPYVPTSVSLGDYVYLWSDAGIVSRVKAATGEVQWQERVGGDYFGSPVCVDGKLFGVATSGEVVVLNTGEKFEVLARNALDEKTHSTPAVAGGRMYIHTMRHLVSVGGKDKVVP